jgi:hypothetical protein
MSNKLPVPTKEELRAFILYHKLKQQDIVDYIGVSIRMVAHYTDDASKHSIDHSKWYTLHHKVTGRVPKG